MAGFVENVKANIDLRRAMRNAERTQPADNVETFPVVEKIERLKARFISANNRVVDTEGALGLAKQAYDDAVEDRETARRELLADLKNSGVFEGVRDFEKAISDA